MANNFVQEGNVLSVTASGADIASGDFVVTGTIGGVALVDIADGDSGSVQISGVFNVLKAAGVVTQGAKLYFHTTNKNITTSSTGAVLVGVAAASALTGDLTVDILLNVGL